VLDGNIYGASLETIRAFVQSMGSPSYADASFAIETEDGALIGAGPAQARRAGGSPRGLRHRDRARVLEPRLRDRCDAHDPAFAFEEMNLHRVSLGVLDDNRRAQRCYESAAFASRGAKRQARFRNGRWCDHILMGSCKTSSLHRIAIRHRPVDRRDRASGRMPRVRAGRKDPMMRTSPYDFSEDC